MFPDSPDGFAAFYKSLYARALPRHALREWIIPLYAARARKKSLSRTSPVSGRGGSLIVFAFRGSSKTTTLSIAFTAFRIGHRPSASNLIIQASDPAAADTAAQIADLIANHPAWKTAFPHIVPDPKVGWGTGGYEIRNTQYEYPEWRAICSQEKGKDPSFIGLGYKSRAIIGKHPTGLLVIDDIHDETNTRSARELRTVTTILTGTILPTVTPQTWQLFVGTPWRENDALAFLSATGQFPTVATPVFRSTVAQHPATNPSPSVISSEGALPLFNGAARREIPLESGKESSPPEANQPPSEKMPAWPSRFPMEEISHIRQTIGEAEFARMYLLDLTAASGIHLRREWLNPYPHQKIEPHWPTIIGVDYASTADKLKEDRRDYFAVAIGRALPGGGIVLQDGFQAKLSQGEAEQELVRLISNYPYTVIVGVEAVAKGEEFLQMMRRGYALPWQPMHPGGRSKGDRFEKFMGVEFQNKRVWISDVETEFLRAFREEWLQWPYSDHDDTLDAVAWMLEAGQQYLFAHPGKENHTNPYLSLGRK